MSSIRFGVGILDNRPGGSNEMKGRLVVHRARSVVTPVVRGRERAEGTTGGMCWSGVGGRSSRLGEGHPLLGELRWDCWHGLDQRVEWPTRSNGQRWDIRRSRHDGGPRSSFPVSSGPVGGYKIGSDVSKNIVNNRKLLVQVEYSPNIVQ
jgi:hypothetical protein